jgi:hypothetical protein
MRTGRLAGVAINQTVCNRRIRRNFSWPDLEIQLALFFSIVRVTAQFHPLVAAVFFF